MGRKDSWNEPVSEEEYEKMKERIEHHFDKMRELMERKLEESEESE